MGLSLCPSVCLLCLSSTGLLNGMPPSTTGSPLSFTVTLTDSNGAVGSRNFALTVDPALTLNPGVLPIATVGSHFSTLLTATGGSGAGYTFRAAGLPAGLTLSPAGVLSGTPTIATSTPTLIGTPFTFTVTATDNRGGTDEQHPPADRARFRPQRSTAHWCCLPAIMLASAPTGNCR